jgi:hypothetical protein
MANEAMALEKRGNDYAREGNYKKAGEFWRQADRVLGVDEI